MADELEINETSTSDDVKSYADQVVKEVETERAGEKSDAQIVSEQSDIEKTPAVTKSGKPSAEDIDDDSVDTILDDQDDDAETESGPEWLTDEVKAEAAAYGIDETEVSDFASREELDRALRLFDKSALDAGRKALAESGDDTPRNEKGQFEKKEPPKTDEPKVEPKSSGYEVSLDSDLYDEEIIGEFTRMRDHYESRLESLESRFGEVHNSAEEQRFDGLVDRLDMPELFGKTGHESEKELEQRRDLHVALKAQMIGLEKLGRPTELNQNLMTRVARMVFADEIGKKELKQRTRKISKQSNRRQGGGATRPQDPREDPRSEADRLYRDIESK